MTPKKSFWHILSDHVKPYRALIIVAGIASIISGSMAALQPLMIKYIIDSGINRPGAILKDKLLYALLFAGLYLVASGVRMISWALGYKRSIIAIEGTLFSIRSNFFRHVQNLCLRFHNEVSSGELFNYIMGSPITSLKQFLSQAVMLAPQQFVTFVISVTMLSFFDWVMTALMIGMTLIIVFINSRSKKVITSISSDFMKTESSVSRFVNDMLRGTRAIKIYAIEEDVSSNFDAQIGQIRKQSESITFRQWLEHAKAEAAQYIGFAVIFAFGAYSCIYRGLSIGKFIAFITSMNVVIMPLMAFLQLNLMRGNAEAGLERIERIMSTEKSTEEPSPQTAKNVKQVLMQTGKDQASIELKDVCFSYDPGRKVFNGLSCKIRHGESVALAGPSGSGKSTFVNILLRLYDPQEGRILLNGADLRQYSLKDLRSSFGVVPQDPFLFQASLLDNIRITQPASSRSTVEKAMEIARLTEFVSELPDGMDTFIGEGGSNLSGGQRQRIAIARAVLGNPEYLIFDEATSALDNDSEFRIQQSLEEIMKDHTVIIIAHRLSTIRNVNRILVFNKGQIVQEGSYHALSEQDGLFRDLLDKSSSKIQDGN